MGGLLASCGSCEELHRLWGCVGEFTAAHVSTALEGLATILYPLGRVACWQEMAV